MVLFQYRCIEQLETEFDISLRWRAFPLNTDTPEDGLPIEVVARQYGVDVADMMGHLHKTAETLNLPVRNIERVYNSRKAQELGLWGPSPQGPGGQKFSYCGFSGLFLLT